MADLGAPVLLHVRPDALGQRERKGLVVDLEQEERADHVEGHVLGVGAVVQHEDAHGGGEQRDDRKAAQRVQPEQEDAPGRVAAADVGVGDDENLRPTCASCNGDMRTFNLFSCIDVVGDFMTAEMEKWTWWFRGL